MDPITINRLLSIADAIEGVHRDMGEIPVSRFNAIVAKQGGTKHPARRARDVLRVLEASRWVTWGVGDPSRLSVTEEFLELVGVWNEGEFLIPMNQGLARYPPYAQFLHCLYMEKGIGIPERRNREGRRRLGQELREKYGLTFVAFDTFRTWAQAVGHAYRSPTDATLYWGGEWGVDKPSAGTFEAACRQAYAEAEKSSGFANLGRLAHCVCMQMRISVQAFEMKMKELVRTGRGQIRLAPATLRRERAADCVIVTVRPRQEILKERLVARLQGAERPRTQWLEYRYLDDGMRIGGRVAKLIRLEEEER